MCKSGAPCGCGGGKSRLTLLAVLTVAVAVYGLAVLISAAMSLLPVVLVAEFGLVIPVGTVLTVRLIRMGRPPRRQVGVPAVRLVRALPAPPLAIEAPRPVVRLVDGRPAVVKAPGWDGPGRVEGR
jgi:hypothetical protein